MRRTQSMQRRQAHIRPWPRRNQARGTYPGAGYRYGVRASVLSMNMPPALCCCVRTVPPWYCSRFSCWEHSHRACDVAAKHTAPHYTSALCVCVWGGGAAPGPRSQCHACVLPRAREPTATHQVHKRLGHKPLHGDALPAEASYTRQPHARETANWPKRRCAILYALPLRRCTAASDSSQLEQHAHTRQLAHAIDSPSHACAPLCQNFIY